MPSAKRRTFTLLDALALVAATALGLAGLRFALGELRDVREELWESLATIASPGDSRPFLWAVGAVYGLTVSVLVPFCWAWTLTILALRLRNPHPRLSRLSRQPGAIACYSASIVLVPSLFGLVFLGLLSWLYFDVRYESPVWQKCLGFFFLLLPASTGIAVIGSWATLFAGRRCLPEPTWIDRTGRMLGVYWISAVLLPLWALS
jgi:MFS family permease